MPTFNTFHVARAIRADLTTLRRYEAAAVEVYKRCAGQGEYARDDELARRKLGHAMAADFHASIPEYPDLVRLTRAARLWRFPGRWPCLSEALIALLRMSVDSADWVAIADGILRDCPAALALGYRALPARSDREQRGAAVPGVARLVDKRKGASSVPMDGRTVTIDVDEAGRWFCDMMGRQSFQANRVGRCDEAGQWEYQGKPDPSIVGPFDSPQAAQAEFLESFLNPACSD